MEEKQMMTNEELESQLQFLRGKATIAKILTYGPARRRSFALSRD